MNILEIRAALPLTQANWVDDIAGTWPESPCFACRDVAQMNTVLGLLTSRQCAKAVLTVDGVPPVLVSALLQWESEALVVRAMTVQADSVTVVIESVGDAPGEALDAAAIVAALAAVWPDPAIEQKYCELLSYLAAVDPAVQQNEDGEVVSSEDVTQLRARLNNLERKYAVLTNSKLGRLQRKLQQIKRKLR